MARGMASGTSWACMKVRRGGAGMEEEGDVREKVDEGTGSYLSARPCYLEVLDHVIWRGMGVHSPPNNLTLY